MAKCDQGYPCAVCGGAVERLRDSELYLRYVIGWVDPETLHTEPDRHLTCNPALAQFIRHTQFTPVVCPGPFSREQLDPEFVAARERLVTRGWERLLELERLSLPIQEYPLPEVQRRWQDGSGPGPLQEPGANLR